MPAKASSGRSSFSANHTPPASRRLTTIARDFGPALLLSLTSRFDALGEAARPVRRQVLTLGSVYVLPCGIDSLFGIRRAHNRFITALVSAVIGDRECCAPAWCKGASPCLRTPRPQRARSAASRCILYLSKQVDVNSVASTAFRYNRQRSQSHSREPYGRLSNAASVGGLFQAARVAHALAPIDRHMTASKSRAQ
jgi:hypothetical protein